MGFHHHHSTTARQPGDRQTDRQAHIRRRGERNERAEDTSSMGADGGAQQCQWMIDAGPRPPLRNEIIRSAIIRPPGAWAQSIDRLRPPPATLGGGWRFTAGLAGATSRLVGVAAGKMVWLPRLRVTAQIGASTRPRAVGFRTCCHISFSLGGASPFQEPPGCRRSRVGYPQPPGAPFGTTPHMPIPPARPLGLIPSDV